MTSLKKTVRTLLAAAAIMVIAPAGAADVVVVKAGAVHTATGEVIENGVVIIEDGRIVAIGADLAVPAGATVIELPEGAITPGLIDANAKLEPTDMISRADETPRAFEVVAELVGLHEGHEHAPNDPCRAQFCQLADSHGKMQPGERCLICGTEEIADIDAMASGVAAGVSRTEFTSEVVPQTAVIDSINFRSPDFARLAGDGVTTVFAYSDSAAVIGPQGAIVHTAGPIRDRVLKARDAVQATMGGDSYRVGGRNSSPNRFSVTTRTRRPNGRMGVLWVFRKTFVDTQKHMRGEAPFGIDVPDDAALEVLAQISRGEIPFRMQARTFVDISVAMELSEEFDLPFVLIEGTESYKMLDAIRDANVPIVYGPIQFAGGGETRNARLSAIKAIFDAGIPTALSAQHLREEDGLSRQAMYAIRMGLSPDDALRAVTAVPAEILGISDEVGTLETGKRGDVVLWSGEPFDAQSRPLVVLVGGEVVVDRRPKE